MMRSEVNATALKPSFNGDTSPTAPGPLRLTAREAYYHLVNIEEHPEVLPLAFDLASSALDSSGAFISASATPPSTESAARIEWLTSQLTAARARFAAPWRQGTPDLTRRQVLHYFMQYMPTAFVDGCWLECGLRVSTAHTPVGATLTGLYAHQVRAFISDPGKHFAGDYRAVYLKIGGPLEEISSRSFAQRTDFHEHVFALPTFLISLAQFTRSFPGEILGVNLAWQFLDLSSFGPALIRDLCSAYELPAPGADLGDPEYLEKSRLMAREAAESYLEGLEGEARNQGWKNLLRGINAAVNGWSRWFDTTRAAAPMGPPDPRQEMLDMLWRKAPHAVGYHGEKSMGDKKIDEHLDPHSFDGPQLLDALANSRYVRPGMSDKSALLRHLVKFGGPMLAVFSPVELTIIQNWIDSLPPRNSEGDPAESAKALHATPAPKGPTIREPLYVTGRGWTPAEFKRRSALNLGDLSTRELYYYLINVEFFPEVLPVAERFARDRLERSMAMLQKGERPIPSWRYDPAALEAWVYRKHREQVDSYRPPTVRPEVAKDAFTEATVQLAPLILIDGAWLQGVASPALIHTTIGRMMFHVMVEEIGEGRSEEHHANIYRELLARMGEAAPQIDTWEFARWSRLQDSSYEVPTLWLSISCFPRHFLPEILGLNLAVELAGIGGPYMEARDTLRKFGLPTLFVDVHNAADNVAAGHSAWAMNSIKRFMDETAEREGPHSLDQTWHRVWTGVRATLPQIGRLRLMAHRIGRRFFGVDPNAVPLIFPS